MTAEIKKEVRQFLSEIGRKGGMKSKRIITPEQQKMMQEARKIKASGK